MKLDRPDRGNKDASADALPPVSTWPDPRRRSRALRTRASTPGSGVTRGYSRFVALMKILLPGLAAVVLGIMLAWPQIEARTEHFVVGFAQLDPRETDPRTLVNPRFHGLDDKEQPYTLIATSAEEKAGNPDRVDLLRPQGDIMLHQGRWIALNGAAGVYSKLERTLDLAGDVTLYRDDGFEFRTEQAHVDLLTSTAHGDEPVRGQGPDGTIRAQGFELVDGGAVVHFTGRSRLVLHNGGGAIAP